MKQKLILALLIILVMATDVSAQGLLGLFGGGNDSKKPIRVQFIEGDENAVEEILLIRIKGVIQEKDDEERMPFKMEKDQFESLKKDLEAARKRNAIKAILLEINSPGGEVTASDVMYHLIKLTREETKKPVVALIGTMGASGAYYVACAAEKILAHPTSIIGSIGVLMQAMNVQQLAEKIGFKAITLKSDKTPMKDVLSPFKEMSEQEKAMLLQIINGIYDRFVEIVSASRKIKKEDVIKIADGGIYSAEKAKELRLIDEIGY
ncbi:MAG: signal peptide peptidase SppA, partial [Candidatus Riflebacteria bacterium]|nr:signal peptide peptidase SppA [Candidatus Riflebacteria bacterium]